MRLSHLLLCSATSLSLLACSRDREDYLDDAVDTACKREDECGNIGQGKSFRTIDDCRVEQRANYNRFWPSDTCRDSRINPDRFDACMARVRSFSCGGLGRIADGISFSSECNADKVCID